MVHCTITAQSFSHWSMVTPENIAATHAFAHCLAMSLTFLLPETAAYKHRVTLPLTLSQPKRQRNEARDFDR
jgi:hypothetical protein